MTYLVTPLDVELDTQTTEQTSDVRAALPPAGLVIIGIGFRAYVLCARPGHERDRRSGSDTSAPTEVLDDADYETRLFA